MKKHKAKSICILSTSYREYDRRMLRISAHLSTLDYVVSWISRSTNFNEELAISTRFSSGVLFYLEYNLRILQIIVNVKPEIIYAVDLDTMLAARMYQRFSGCELIFDSHEYFTEVPELKGKRIKKAIWSQLGKWAIKSDTTCITVNSSLSKILSEKYGQQFHVVRNVPPQRSLPLQHIETLGDDKKVILYLGAVNVGRGLEIACDAVKSGHLSEDYELWIVGDGDILSQLQKTYKDVNAIKFYGWVAPDQLSDILTQAWIGINMLDAVSKSYYYSLTNKYFDYIQHQLPAIHMDYPEYQALQEQYPVSKLVKEYTINGLIDGIQHYNDPSEYKKSKLACKEASLDLNWESESAKLSIIMKGLKNS